MAAAIRLVATAFTHRGAVRPGNEDAVAVGDWVSAGGSMAEPVTLEREVRGAPVACLVADGLGGHAAGEVASRLAAERLAARIAAGAAGDGGDGGDGLAALLRGVDAELDGLARARPELAGMGTTVAGLLVRPDGRVAVFNVGDSRVYRIDADGDGAGLLVQLSTDDTPGPKLADGRTAVLTTPQITQSLGGGAHAPGGIVPHVLEERVGGEGAGYLICSDGVTDLVGRDEMADLLRDAGDDGRAGALTLFEAAMARGGRDNVSIVLARVRRVRA